MNKLLSSLVVVAFAMSSGAAFATEPKANDPQKDLKDVKKDVKKEAAAAQNKGADAIKAEEKKKNK